MPINPLKIQQLVGGQPDLLAEMLRLFAKDLQEHYQQLQALQSQAATMNDYQRLLHRLMGSASYFSANDLRTALLQADLLCQQAVTQALLDTALDLVYQEIQRILNCDLMQQAQY